MAYRITGTIRLIAPMLYNAVTPSELKKADEGSSGARKTIVQKQGEALDKSHKLPDGTLCVPRHNFKKCLLGGVYSAGLKERNKNLGPYIDATVFVVNDLSFGTDQPDEIFEHWGRIPPGPKGKLANIRRPKMKEGRTLDFILDVFDDKRNADQIRDGLTQAGLYVGLGAWRPTYGRFVIEKWEVQQQGVKAAEKTKKK